MPNAEHSQTMSPQQASSTGTCGSVSPTDLLTLPANASFRGNEPGAPYRWPSFAFLRDEHAWLPAAGTLTRTTSGASLLDILDAALAIAAEEEQFFSELADEFAEEENEE